MTRSPPTTSPPRSTASHRRPHTRPRLDRGRRPHEPPAPFSLGCRRDHPGRGRCLLLAGPAPLSRGQPAASNPLGRANFATTIPSEARSEPAPGRPGGPRHPRRRPLTLRRLTAALAAGTALIWGAGALVAQV